MLYLEKKAWNVVWSIELMLIKVYMKMDILDIIRSEVGLINKFKILDKSIIG